MSDARSDADPIHAADCKCNFCCDNTRRPIEWPPGAPPGLPGHFRDCQCPGCQKSREAQTQAKVPGLGPDAPTVVNKTGGKQSDTPARLDLFPPAAWVHVGRILKVGATKYGEDNWRRISAREHVNHCLVHLAAWLMGDRQDDHLGHAACRAMMALEMHLEEDWGTNE